MWDTLSVKVLHALVKGKQKQGFFKQKFQEKSTFGFKHTITHIYEDLIVK